MIENVSEVESQLNETGPSFISQTSETEGKTRSGRKTGLARERLLRARQRRDSLVMNVVCTIRLNDFESTLHFEKNCSHCWASA